MFRIITQKKIQEIEMKAKLYEELKSVIPVLIQISQNIETQGIEIEQIKEKLRRLVG